jgi:hypothetical protein
LNNLITWIFGIILTLIAGWGGIQKAKASKATKAKEKAESERDVLIIKTKIDDTATKAKDDILAKQKQNAQDKQKTDQKISQAEEVPEDEKLEQQQEIIDNTTDLFNSRNRPN